ncbi:class I SAM-dependent methyltransferase [Cognatiyoonia sp. IB215446]|uniref:class I SAM-dependent methyltransferase n=1 Tax=Cognatiyoonia sp. IB215446 TaxID=3097355 RepID=UPI002A18621C|nr:class I SAM-dependent methyltransferase [Cognatiyoonia sp. IB215446]MDX8349930.1 class I SAM-dependent methyltransferase [Cognatiyoonia sp. IB215446]
MHDISGRSFQSAELSDNYVHRPPYAPQIYACIAEHAASTKRLLDLGCGEGKLARPLARLFDNVVAVDPSEKMLALGQSLENGDAPNIDWIAANAEDAPLSGHFDMVTFASSIHWMDCDRLFPKLKPHLNPQTLLAFVEGDQAFEPPWEAEWRAFLAKWVPMVTAWSLDSAEWLAWRDKHLRHVAIIDTFEFLSPPIRQSVGDFILCQYSRNTFSPLALGNRTTQFADELRELLAGYANADGMLEFRVKTHLTFARSKD